MAGSSRPGSGGCHEILHAIDQLFPGTGNHGELAGVGALFCTYLRGEDRGRALLSACLARHGLPRTPADLGLSHAEFSKAVREKTGDGVDIVFEHVGPATLNESMRSVVSGGRIVICGSTSGVKAEIMMPRLFWGQMDMLGSTMGNVGEFRAVLDAIDHGLKPVVDQVYPLSDVEAALTRLDAAEQFGKVVLSMEG